MTKNIRKQVSKDKISEIVNKYKDNTNVFMLILNGRLINDKNSYINILKKKLNISLPFWNNWDAYIEILEDSYTYYNKEEIVIIIEDYDCFSNKDLGLKRKIEEFFDIDILPFFEDEIEKCVVGGKKTKYNIYYSL